MKKLGNFQIKLSNKSLHLHIFKVINLFQYTDIVDRGSKASRNYKIYGEWAQIDKKIRNVVTLRKVSKFSNALNL